MGNLFSDFLERFKTASGPKLKKLVFWATAIFCVLLVVIIVSNQGTKKRASFSKVSLMSRETTPKKELNYEFIKFDTIKIPSFAPVETPILEQPGRFEPAPLTITTKQPKRETPPVKKTERSIPSQTEAILSQGSIFDQARAVNKNPNMIVTNNMAENAVQGSSAATFAGMQSSLIKVVLPNRTPVASGSLLEARVLKDVRWGNVFIPRRSKLIGIVSLINRRVNIEFREIFINNTSRACRGRAYDIKHLQGLAYSPVTSEAKRILVEELRDAVSGVPVVGRVANRATYSSNYYDQDVSELDEGLEFYALIESIY